MNENEKPRYKLPGRATGVDPEGYYFPRWDIAEAVTGWGIICDSIEEIVSPEAVSS